MNKEIVLKLKVSENDPLVLIDFLALKSNLSKSILKKLLNNGGIWLKKFKSKKRVRVRRATTEINHESIIELYYHPDLFNLTVDPPKEILRKKDWGIWYKPSGMLSEGNNYGDHCSILRSIEKIKNTTNLFLVHRLDREAHGLILVAYSKIGAAKFSEMWQKSKVNKIYRAIVLGDLRLKYPTGEGKIDYDLDGKKSLTEFKIIGFSDENTIVEIKIHTGRTHQIRRHFEMISYPLIGDPKYGKNNKNKDGLKLLAYKLEFMDPFSKEMISVALEDYKL